MNIVEQIFTHKKIPVSYKLKPADQDRRHLLVVFSGFGSPVEAVYNFAGRSAASCRSTILWIKDDFDGACGYYLCQKMDFSIEEAVIALIEKVMFDLRLCRSQCTLLGFSKGGSAALYFGIKYDFSNIIAAAPQIKIGSFVAKEFPRTANKMVSSDVEKDLTTLDSLIPSLIRSDLTSSRNIYLITSYQDTLYESEIKPFINEFNRYQNFNLVCTRSSLVWHHNVVNRYNIPIILSIIYANAEGAFPKFGRVVNGNVDLESEGFNQYVEKVQAEPMPIVDINRIEFSDDLFFPQGDAFIKGFKCNDFGILKRKMIFSNKVGTYTYPLGTVRDLEASYRHFDRYFIDYQMASFVSVKHAGIDLDALPDGVYDMEVELKTNDTLVKTKAVCKQRIDKKTSVKGNELRIFGGSSGLKLSKRSIKGTLPIDCIFRVEKGWHKNGLLHYEGIFAVNGVEVEDWSDANYYLGLDGNGGVYSFAIGKCSREFISQELSGGFANYSKCYFSTPNFQGVSLDSVPAGKYKVFISFSHKGSLFTKYIDDEILIGEKFHWLN